MEFTREIQGGNTYLVYQIQPEDQIDTLSLGMIVNNKIEGIAPTIYNQMDNRKFLKYNISSKVSLEQFFTGTVVRQRLLNVIDSILEGIEAAEDYMLESRMLLLYPGYIFVDVSTWRAVLICVPTLDICKESIDPGTFFKAIMFNTRFDESENGDYIAKIISYLNSTAEISVADFKQLVKGLMQETEEQKIPEPSPTRLLNKIPIAPTYAVNTESTDQKAAEPKAELPQMPGSGMMVKEQPKVDVQQPLPNVQIPSAAAQNPEMGFAIPGGSERNPEMGFAIPGGSEENLEPEGKKNKKKKEKKEKKQKETVVKEKPQKEKKGFSLFGRKKKQQVEDSEQLSNTGFPVPQQVSIQPVQPPINAPVAPPDSVVQGMVQPAKAVNISEPQNRYAEVKIQAGGIGETTVLGNGASGETVVLSGGNPTGKSNPRLTRVRNREQIVIDKPLFRIGKERSYVDYFIGDNPAVSRSHANISVRQDGCYIEDTNSTNHTYVNDKMIVSGSAVKLEQGARIRLGNEEFVFQY